MWLTLLSPSLPLSCSSFGCAEANALQSDKVNQMAIEIQKLQQQLKEQGISTAPKPPAGADKPTSGLVSRHTSCHAPICLSPYYTPFRTSLAPPRFLLKKSDLCVVFLCPSVTGREQQQLPGAHEQPVVALQGPRWREWRADLPGGLPVQAAGQVPHARPVIHPAAPKILHAYTTASYGPPLSSTFLFSNASPYSRLGAEPGSGLPPVE